MTELETQVASKTAHLNRAIDELMREMDETKRMSEIIQINDTTPVARPSAQDGDTEFETRSGRRALEDELLNTVLGRELVAHF